MWNYLLGISHLQTTQVAFGVESVNRTCMYDSFLGSLVYFQHVAYSFNSWYIIKTNRLIVCWGIAYEMKKKVGPNIHGISKKSFNHWFSTISFQQVMHFTFLMFHFVKMGSLPVRCQMDIEETGPVKKILCLCKRQKPKLLISLNLSLKRKLYMHVLLK